MSPQEEEKESEDIEENSVEECSVHEHSVHEHSVDEHSGEEQSLKEHSVEGHLREEHLIEEDLSGLFIFSLGECDATQCYITATQREAPGPVTLQESCDHYLQQRWHFFPSFLLLLHPVSKVLHKCLLVLFFAQSTVCG